MHLYIKGLKNLRLINKSFSFKRPFLTASFKELDQFPSSINDYKSLHKFSIEQPEIFWSTLARSRLQWYQDFEQVTSGKFTDKNFNLKWFINGKLNVSVNCVDRHYLTDPKRIALIWDRDEPDTEEYVTYEQLYMSMNRIANMLKAHGIKRGDRVAIYMPTCPTTVAAMLACTRIGAIHSIVFAGFSDQALASRINDSQCKAILTCNQAVRAGKFIPLKKIVDSALESCPSVKNVFVFQRTDTEVKLGPKDILADSIIDQFATECTPEIMDSEDALFMLYTSGSTGKPKGLIHTQAGYLLHVALSQQLVFNYSPGDVFGCLADVGWITGHSYVVYGPLCNGGTSVLFESTPVFPDPGRYWKTVEKLRINQLYLAPTSLRMLMKYGVEYVKKYDKSSLKCLGSVGEPLNVEAWEWFHEHVGERRCRIADTWWQTETGGNCITPTPCDRTLVHTPAHAMLPFLGINAVLVDEKGQIQPEKDSRGVLCIKQPWPGMARTIYNDHDRFLNTYFSTYPGYYFTGDGALLNEEGHFQITGRVDDVMNVSGHRIGTAEVEDALMAHKSVAEAAVVGYPHEVLGEGIYAYVILNNNIQVEEKILVDELKSLVRKNISGFAVPHYFLVVSGLPKTRSGKIMRRILRKIAANASSEEFGDISTLSEPNVVSDILNKHKKQNKK